MAVLDKVIGSAGDPATAVPLRLRRARLRALTGGAPAALEDLDAALEVDALPPAPRARVARERRRLALLAEAAGEGEVARWALALLAAAAESTATHRLEARRLLERALALAPGLGRVVKVAGD
ncbi:MAG: hypothetical protein M9894_24695 [Planctomycetes bacterium]|nr:hypothetical protein [Planctomycetota bacterium]